VDKITLVSKFTFIAKRTLMNFVRKKAFTSPFTSFKRGVLETTLKVVVKPYNNLGHFERKEFRR